MMNVKKIRILFIVMVIEMERRKSKQQQLLLKVNQFMEMQMRNMKENLITK